MEDILALILVIVLIIIIIFVGRHLKKDDQKCHCGHCYHCRVKMGRLSRFGCGTGIDPAALAEAQALYEFAQ